MAGVMPAVDTAVNERRLRPIYGITYFHKTIFSRYKWLMDLTMTSELVYARSLC